ncbi:hypothetical protein IFM89_033739 [Coptis chinensis]|uniref:Uncharacterized protein n=1 Tax=Coptis chinensis TaxID=261450 RepID=A0A835LK67_9MAGN|nr:hypothetical protein IFM89_033739 [Coptis chinensis]
MDREHLPSDINIVNARKRKYDIPYKTSPVKAKTLRKDGNMTLQENDADSLSIPKVTIKASKGRILKTVDDMDCGNGKEAKKGSGQKVPKEGVLGDDDYLWSGRRKRLRMLLYLIALAQHRRPNIVRQSFLGLSYCLRVWNHFLSVPVWLENFLSPTRGFCTLGADLGFNFSVCMRLDGSDTQSPTSGADTTLRYGTDASKLHVEGAAKSYPVNEKPVAENLGMDENGPEQGVASHNRTAKIHDFCLGIPFGGLVLSGGLVGSILSRNLTTLGIGMLFGGGLLALSISSLKVWKDGKSSFPFMLGQAVLSAAFFWKHLQNYSLTKKVFPSGFYVVISAAMLCFYTYVVASGGNPPPKKLKVATNPSS